MVARPAGSCCTPATRRVRGRAVVPGTTQPPLTSGAATPTRKPSRNGTAGKRKKERTSWSCAVEVRSKMEALSRLMAPAGGAGGEVAADVVDVDELLFRAAGYIVRLQAQVKAMQLMVDVLEHTTHDP